MSKKYDLILLGATGVTGSRCLDYLMCHYSNFNFAIAGRNQSKLESLLVDSPIKKPIIIVDTNQQQSIEDMVKQTKLVLTTVGPFIKYGDPIVAACVKHSTHYVDSTGEPHFIEQIIQKYHEDAVAKGIYILPSCGYDSIPSDLGSYLIAHHFASKHQQKTGRVHLSVEQLKGSVSNGTISSAIDILARGISSKTCLCDPSVEPREDAVKEVYLEYIKEIGRWQSANPMQFGDVRYVNRSYSLLQNVYGPNFQFSEGHGHRYLFTAILANIALLLGVVFLRLFFAQKLVDLLFPPGKGPTKEQMAKGGFYIKGIGISGPSVNQQQKKVLLKIVGISDPGYSETCKMLVESCMTLLGKKPNQDVSDGVFPIVNGGVCTASTALGLPLADKLRKKGMVWSVVDL